MAQAKGLQAEYMRATSAPAPGGKAGGEDKAAGGGGEAEALKRQVDRLIAEKDTLQVGGCVGAGTVLDTSAGPENSYQASPQATCGSCLCCVAPPKT